MELSKLQKDILNYNKANNIFVDAAPAAGKTTLIAHKIVQAINDKSPYPVVAFTYTNAAAAEIYERIGGSRPNLFIGTIHSYITRILSSCGITEVLNYCEQEAFDEVITLAIRNCEYFPHLHYLICDEMQDSDEAQLQFIFDILDADHRFCCYDKRQSIYQFRGAVPDKIDTYIEQTKGHVLYLNENYRNDKSILQFAKNIIKLNGYSYYDSSVPISQQEGQVIECDYSPIAILRDLPKFGKFGDWFILCRTNTELNEMKNYLEQSRYPYDTFKQADLTSSELAIKLKENTIKLLTIHSAKGLEANNVVVIGARMKKVDERCISYVAATRARHLLVWTTIKRPNRQKIAGVHYWE